MYNSTSNGEKLLKSNTNFFQAATSDNYVNLPKASQGSRLDSKSGHFCIQSKFVIRIISLLCTENKRSLSIIHLWAEKGRWLENYSINLASSSLHFEPFYGKVHWICFFGWNWFRPGINSDFLSYPIRVTSKHIQCLKRNFQAKRPLKSNMKWFYAFLWHRINSGWLSLREQYETILKSRISNVFAKRNDFPIKKNFHNLYSSQVLFRQSKNKLF